MRPPIRDAEVRLSLPARPENVAVVRHLMSAFADAFDYPAETMEDVRLAVTEACTNVVRHAYGEVEGLIDVHVRPEPDRLEITIADTGRGIARSADREGPGYGLPMLAKLADTLEIDRTVHAGSRVAMSFNRERAPVRAA